MKKLSRNVIVLVLAAVMALSTVMLVSASEKVVTSKDSKSIMKMLHRFDYYLGYEIAFSDPKTKFVFNDYAKTNMVLMNSVPYGMSVSDAKRKYRNELKMLFGNAAQFKMVKFKNSNYQKRIKLQNIYQNDKGVVRYCGGDWGDSHPVGKVSSIVSTNRKSFTVTYKIYRQSYGVKGKTYRGTYRINLKKSNNTYGFMITDITRTKVGA